MHNTIISDTSCLILLDKIDALDILQHLFSKSIVDGRWSIVNSECHPDKGGIC